MKKDNRWIPSPIFLLISHNKSWIVQLSEIGSGTCMIGERTNVQKTVLFGPEQNHLERISNENTMDKTCGIMILTIQFTDPTCTMVLSAILMRYVMNLCHRIVPHHAFA